MNEKSLMTQLSAHEQAMDTLAEAQVICDYADYVELNLTDLLDRCEVHLVFPTVADLKLRGVEAEHTVKLTVNDRFLVSCCGTDPEVTIHRLFRWAEEMFDVDGMGCGDA